MGSRGPGGLVIFLLQVFQGLLDAGCALTKFSLCSFGPGLSQQVVALQTLVQEFSAHTIQVCSQEHYIQEAPLFLVNLSVTSGRRILVLDLSSLVGGVLHWLFSNEFSRFCNAV